MGVEDPREMERLADELPLEKAASRWLVSSDPDEHMEQIRPYVELGFTPPRVPRPGQRPVRRFLDLYSRATSESATGGPDGGNDPTAFG